MLSSARPPTPPPSLLWWCLCGWWWWSDGSPSAAATLSEAAGEKWVWLRFLRPGFLAAARPPLPRGPEPAPVLQMALRMLLRGVRLVTVVVSDGVVVGRAGDAEARACNGWMPLPSELRETMRTLHLYPLPLRKIYPKMIERRKREN